MPYVEAFQGKKPYVDSGKRSQTVFYSFTYKHICVADEMPHSILLHNSEDLLNFPTLAGIIKLTSDKVHIDERQEF